MNDELCLAQLNHPAKEPSIGKKDDVVPWNSGKHHRKFLRCKGSYVGANDNQIDADLMFWGEWEPQSKIITRFGNPPIDYPKFLQEPLWPCKYPTVTAFLSGCAGSCMNYCNTDPYIFDKNGFIYSNCRQMRAGGATQMAHLKIGSLILFGSIIKNNKGQSYFGIDTVFVVDSFASYSQNNYQSIYSFITNKDFFKITPLNNLYLGNAILRCYRGATYSNREKNNGMYSFVPCKVCNGIPKQGFERLKLTSYDLKRIEQKIGCSNLLHYNLQVHHTQALTINQIKIVWEEIRKLNKQQGLLEGTQFFL